MLNSSAALQLWGVSSYIFYFELAMLEQMFEENNVLNSLTDSGLQCCFMPLLLGDSGKTSVASL